MADLSNPRTHQWRQGAAVPHDLSGLDIGALGFEPFPNPKDLFLLISHDCDICHWSFEDESEVEIILAQSIPNDASDGNYQDCRNSRMLQFYNLGQLFQCTMLNRRSIDRHLLTNDEFHPNCVLEHNALQSIQRWLHRRYNRPSFPTEFNNRTTEAKKFLIQKMKKVHDGTAGIYLRLDTYSEANDTASYTILAYLISPEKQSNEQIANSSKIVALLHKAFSKCHGVELKDVVQSTEAHVTIARLKQLRRWDYHDYLSVRQGNENELEPAE